MKKILFVLFWLAVVLGAVGIVRAFRMPSLQGSGEATVPIAVDTAGAVQRLSRAIRIPTISHEDVADTDSSSFRALHEYFVESYPLVHASLQRELVGGLSLLYTWTGSEPDLEPVVLMGHQDVVPVIPGTEGDWDNRPFSGAVVGGEVWGRGALDDKIGVVSILEAVEALLSQGFRPRRTVYLAFGHDEEVGGVRGAAAIARLLESRGAEPYALVVDEGGAVAEDLVPGLEGPVALVGIAEKGHVNLELVVQGAGGHSSTPPPNTSIGILATAISRLEEDPFPTRFEGPTRSMFEYLAPEMSLGFRTVFANLWLLEPLVVRRLASDPVTAAMVRTTTAATIIEGGVKANVLPTRARAVVNHRILPGETKFSVLERVRSTIADDRVQVEVLGEEGVEPSPVSDPTGAAFRLLAHTLRQVLGGRDLAVAPYLVTGFTDAKYYSGRSSNVFRFRPAPVGPDALELAHGTNERTSVQGLATCIAFFQQLIRNSDDL